MIGELLQHATRFSRKEIHTTSTVFKLITRVTVNILILFIVLICSTYIFGHPIECFGEPGKLLRLISLKCWAEGVFIDRAFLNGSIGRNIISYGVGNTKSSELPSVTHQRYYQLIPPLLALHALILYLPRGFWKLFENGLMSKLLDKLNSPVMQDDWKDKREHLLLYMKNIQRKQHRFYVIKYFLCEVMSLCSVLFNMLLLKWIVNNFWVEYQPAISSLLHADMNEFQKNSAVLFPFQAKCNVSTFGGSGSIVNHDALCFMPQNVVNEKIFVFLYFWYIGVLLLSVMNVVYFFTMLMFNSLRIIDVGRMCERTMTRRECKKVSCNGDFGYWFTLKIFHKNLSPVLFQDLATELQERAAKSSKIKTSSRKSSRSEDDDDYEDDLEKY